MWIGDSSAARAACALTGPDACDFGSLIGNDDFYGGLGGAFVVGTRSEATGTVVLRHEMGHNFVSAGDEYDHSWSYFGANSDTRASSSVKWAHWLTEPDQPVVEQAATYRLLEYPWYNLAGGQRSYTFTSDGTYSRWLLRISASGCDSAGSFRIWLDGQELDWAPHTAGSVDRFFYEYNDPDAGFSAGTHTIAFASGHPPGSGAPIRQLCSFTLHEYKGEDQFKMQPGYVGVYPTWSDRYVKSYRPTNELCLMRNMSSTDFCPVCKEEMWLQFLQRMSLIDGHSVASAGGTTTVTVTIVPVAQFRPEPIPGVTEQLDVMWARNGVTRPELAGQFSFSLPNSDAAGNWVATVVYTTSEVRRDPHGLLTFIEAFTV